LIADLGIKTKGFYLENKREFRRDKQEIGGTE